MKLSKLAPWDCILGSCLGSNFETCFGSICGPCPEAPRFCFNSWAPKRYLKMEPKQGPKLNAIPGRQLCRKMRRRFSRHDLQLKSGLLSDPFQLYAANHELQPKKERKLRPTNLLKQRRCLRLQAKHSQEDMTFLQKIHSAVSRMGKSTACLLL